MHWGAPAAPQPLEAPAPPPERQSPTPSDGVWRSCAARLWPHYEHHLEVHLRSGGAAFGIGCGRNAIAKHGNYGTHWPFAWPMRRRVLSREKSPPPLSSPKHRLPRESPPCHKVDSLTCRAWPAALTSLTNQRYGQQTDNRSSSLPLQRGRAVRWAAPGAGARIGINPTGPDPGWVFLGISTVVLTLFGACKAATSCKLQDHPRHGEAHPLRNDDL